MLLRRFVISTLSFMLVTVIGMLFLVQIYRQRSAQRSVPGSLSYTVDKLENLQFQSQELKFPYRIPGTTLVLEAFVSYEGEFVEDSSYCQVSNAASMLIRNEGDKMVSQAEVCLSGQFGSYRFVMTCLPAQAALLVQERSQKNYAVEKFTDITVEQFLLEEYDSVPVEIMDTGDGGIGVINRSDKSVSGLWLGYKTRYPEGDFLIGGVTQRVFIGTLQPGETVYIYPERYADDYSEIVFIKGSRA